ncbi:MAG: hypothetical protein JWP44_4439 [Mucilaginibacter sp.]|nr:hypothetical protein [Mucilaginibacter sp.]
MAGVNFSLDSAKRIVAAVKKIEGVPTDLSGNRLAPRAPGTSFWAMITGAADISGRLFSWVAVQPSAAMATPADSTILAPSNMWQFQVPYVAGFGNAREANDNREVPAGTVVLLTFMGYAVPAGTTSGPGTSTVPASTTAPPTGADGSIPIYVFNYCAQTQQAALPIHDHRDNSPTAGGFAFSVYHPGCALPQQPWSV